MMPDNELSSTPITTPLMFPKNLPTVGLEAFELGGVALNDPSQGLMVKSWRAFANDDGDVYVESDDDPPVFQFSAPNISTISLTFDHNMEPFVAFTQPSGAKFYWFDTFDGQHKITDLPTGSTWPRASLDDKRRIAAATSDIILAYIRDGNLYFRQQRDRYLVEYLLYPDLNIAVIDPTIIEVGMGTNLRFQFHCSGSFFPV